MNAFRVKPETRGFTLVEALVTIAVFALVFGGLFGIVQLTLRMIGNAKATTSAISLANERMEYIRSLSYNNIGTVSGIPNGPIPQNATSTLNGILFHERVLIQYVDSPDDGEGAGDTNGILADYKQIKVEYTWQGLFGTSTIFLLSNIVPAGIESTAGGGTLTVNVFDSTVQPVSGAGVRVINRTTTSTIDTTQYTNASGIAMFAGAPAAANYEIIVSKLGYSSDQTYSATTTNPNPATLPAAVVESAVSTMNFQIDTLSDLTVRTIEPPIYGSFIDTFADSLLVGTSTQVVVSGGSVELAGGPGAYVPSGTIFSTSTIPSTIVRWDSALVTANIPASTGLVTHVYDVTAPDTYTLISEADLPGNTAGFTSGTIDLGALSVASHPALALGATLTSTDVGATPQIQEWNITHVVSEPVLSSIPFTMTGAKTIGTALDASPIYKYSDSHTTDGSGEVSIQDLEFDSYSIDLDTGAYDIAEACGNIPYALNAGVDDTLTLTLVPNVARTFRVYVTDENNIPVQDATVAVSRSGYADSADTSSCGQVFFNTGLSSADDYEITITKSGFDAKTVSAISITGDAVLDVMIIHS